MKPLIRLLGFILPYRGRAVAALLLLFGMVGADLLIPRLTQKIIDDGIIAGDLRVVLGTALVMVGAALLSATFAVTNNYLSVWVAMHFSADVRSSLMRKIQTFSFGNLDTLQTGKLIVRSTSDIRQVTVIVMLALRILTRAPIWAIGAVILLVLTSPRLALLLAAFVPLIVGLLWLLATRANPLFTRVQQRLDRLNTVLQENLAGIRVVRAFVRTGFEQDRFDSANSALMEQTIEVARLLAVFMPLVMLVLNFAVAGAVWIGGTLAFSGSMSVGEVVAAINYISFALFPIIMLAAMMGPISAAGASAARIMEVFDTQPQISQNPSARKLVNPKGHIVFDRVSFSYNREMSDPVLSDVSFTAEPGETVAIVGATGSGKSTLIHLIPRFHDVSSGRITFDGCDIRELELRSLRSAISVVLQETVLFNGSVRDNIRYGRRDAAESEIVEAAVLAQADDFIRELPQGYDTEIGQRGVKLSGGQRQRIAIARALLVRPRVLILDDSTSALDIETEIRLQDALDTMLRQPGSATTRFVVAQRISTVLLADKIIVLDNGRVSAMGPYRQLLRDSRVFRDIYASQLGEPETAEGVDHG
jgi:ATP-binding cassette subfamily B multidrug efflux pump